jgi:outer membrane protein OmpA-like peptidoglycan-associated protein
MIIVVNNANAQVEPLLSEKFAIHPKVGFGFTNNSANFHNFQGTTDCGLFQKGVGSGVSAFIIGEYPLSPSSFIGLGVGYIDRSSTLTVPGSFASYDATTKTITTITTENTIHATLGLIEIQPEFRFSLIPNFISGPLRAVGAARFIIPVSGSFIQNESIVSPENAAFISTGKREQTRQIAAGQITTLSPLGIGISAGIENLLKVGANTFFTQQALIDYNFSNITTDAEWKQIAVRIELGLRFSILPPKEQPQIIAPPPPPPPAPPAKPIATIELTNVKAELHTGNEIIASSALVNIIFFNQKSSEIPSKYKTTVSDSKQMQSDPIKNHENVLPHIASILKNNPKATVILEAATSGLDDEPEGLDLAKARAESVRNALVSLGISSERITSRASVLPRNPSNQDFPEGRIENRRVDIVVQNAPLQEYVSRRQVTQVFGTATATITSKNIPEGEQLAINSNCMDAPIAVTAQNEITIPMNCKISNEQTEFTFKANLSSPSVRAEAKQTVPITKLPIRQVDLKVDNFEAILRFDYNSSELSQSNKELIRQMIEPLPPGTSITIYGSTDALGTGLRNQQLSDERAKGTEEFIRSLSGNKFKIKTATQTDKFPEATPEGRFLNRSMRIRLVK